MATVVKAPEPLPVDDPRPKVFLAGSIEQGRAEDWQTRVTAALWDFDVVVLNPRRDDWDATWRQSIDDPQFRRQVEWELDALELATHVPMYFDPKGQAPITLLELGLFARTGKVLACCPDGFWRKGNVEVVCARFHVPLVPTLEDLLVHLRLRLRP